MIVLVRRSSGMIRNGPPTPRQRVAEERRRQVPEVMTPSSVLLTMASSDESRDRQARAELSLAADPRGRGHLGPPRAGRRRPCWRHVSEIGIRRPLVAAPSRSGDFRLADAGEDLLFLRPPSRADSEDVLDDGLPPRSEERSARGPDRMVPAAS